MRYLHIAYVPLLLSLFSASPQTVPSNRPALVLEGKAARVAIDLGGGSIFDFRLNGHLLNPLTWDSKGKPADPRPMGHFLCLDRWGAPSAAEQRNGMPYHGEASRVKWRVVSPAVAKGNKVEAEMAASLPIAGLDVTRRLRLSRNAAFFTVLERVTNRNKLGRIYNMVQHPTIAPPFLDEKTLVDANARKGFMQSSPLPNPEQPAVDWPHALKDGQAVEMRRLLDDAAPNVVSYTIDDEYGWTTASSLSGGLLIGYIWKAIDYPWFNAWRHVEGGRPAARGLEFGTTGLHQPFPILVLKGRIFEQPLYTYLDAGETETRSYACFLLRIPQDYKGVAKVTYTEGRLRLYEHGNSERELSLEVGDLFAEQ
jgi:hypothetical protein